MTARRFRARLSGKKLRFDDSRGFQQHVERFREDEVLAVTVERAFRRRTQGAEGEPSNQNGYYWGEVLPIIAAETGHTPEELHEIFKRMFLPKKIIEYRGKNIALPGSTTEQNTGSFAEYIERIRAEAATMGITIPDPET